MQVRARASTLHARARALRAGALMDSFVIEIVEPDRRPRRVTISTTLEFGRECNGVILTGIDASRRHAALTPAADGLTLTDLGSTNGTLANGVRVTAPVTVTVGDEIRMGDATVRVVERQAAPPPASLSAPTMVLPTVVPPPPPPAEAALAVRIADLAALTRETGATELSALLDWCVETLKHYVTHLHGRYVSGTSIATGITVVLPDAAAAVDCALLLGDALADRNRAAAQTPVTVACGVDVVAAGSAPTAAVAVGARAGAGDILVSTAVAAAIAGRTDLAVVEMPGGSDAGAAPGELHGVRRR